jgi:hypothetical protein
VAEEILHGLVAERWKIEAALRSPNDPAAWIDIGWP